MSITSGFYNTKYYDADQFGDMFNGIIKDGVFSTVGNQFLATPGGGLTVNIDTGKAWFAKRWIINDAIINHTVMDEAPVLYPCIVAVVIETNNTTHESSIVSVIGDASDTPVKPELTNDEFISQHAICYVSIAASAESISAADIEMVVGTDETPFVTGVLQQVSIEQLLTDWGVEFETALDDWKTLSQEEFEAWFANLENQLDDNQAANLQHQIDEINTYLQSMGNAEDYTY